MKRDSQVRAILFDFGGVIAAGGFAEGLRVIARQQGLDAETLPAQAMDAVYDSWCFGATVSTGRWRPR